MRWCVLDSLSLGVGGWVGGWVGLPGFAAFGEEGEVVLDEDHGLAA